MNQTQMIKTFKNYLYNIAMKSPLRKWALSLTGWKWWVWQLVVGGIVFAVLELLLNLIDLTMLPWRQKKGALLSAFSHRK